MTEISAPAPVVFGIGCFSLEAPSADLLLMANPKGTYSVHDWAADVERFLAAFPSIDEIRVEGFHSVRGDHRSTWRDATVEAIKSIEHDGMHRGGDLRPHPTDGRVSFVITIPARTQVGVMYAAEGRSGTRFDVDIFFTWGMPVAFVRTYADVDDPSLAVAIVREFMRKEAPLRAQEDNPIRFVAMGPSPMWSNFALLPGGDDQDEEISFERVESPGYSWGIFRAKQSQAMPGRNEAYSVLKARLSEAASAYYEFVSQGQVLGYTRRFIEAELEDLVESNRANGLSGWWKRLRGGGQKANDLMLEILAAQLTQRRAATSNAETWEGITDPIGRAAFDEHVMRELESSHSDYVDNAREVVDLLNSRYGRDIEIVFVVLASVLGGVVGAVVTALAGLAAGS